MLMAGGRGPGGPPPGGHRPAKSNNQ
jgi:hypothetical protein